MIGIGLSRKYKALALMFSATLLLLFSSFVSGVNESPDDLITVAEAIRIEPQIDRMCFIQHINANATSEFTTKEEEHEGEATTTFERLFGPSGIGAASNNGTINADNSHKFTSPSMYKLMSKFSTYRQQVSENSMRSALSLGISGTNIDEQNIEENIGIIRRDFRLLRARFCALWMGEQLQIKVGETIAFYLERVWMAKNTIRSAQEVEMSRLDWLRTRNVEFLKKNGEKLKEMNRLEKAFVREQHGRYVNGSSMAIEIKFVLTSCMANSNCTVNFHVEAKVDEEEEEEKQKEQTHMDLISISFITLFIDILFLPSFLPYEIQRKLK